MRQHWEFPFRNSLEIRTLSVEKSIWKKINKSLWNLLELFGSWEQTVACLPIMAKHCTDASKNIITFAIYREKPKIWWRLFHFSSIYSYHNRFILDFKVTGTFEHLSTSLDTIVDRKGFYYVKCKRADRRRAVAAEIFCELCFRLTNLSQPSPPPQQNALHFRGSAFTVDADVILTSVTAFNVFYILFCLDVVVCTSFWNFTFLRLLTIKTFLLMDIVKRHQYKTIVYNNF